jgi:hypothetical protein
VNRSAVDSSHSSTGTSGDGITPVSTNIIRSDSGLRNPQWMVKAPAAFIGRNSFAGLTLD